MKIELEVTGGFTGRAGKQLIRVDTDQLNPTVAAQLHKDLEQLPESSWGQSFESPHPKPWDFLHQLRVVEGDTSKSVRFHFNQGPPALSRIAEQLKEIHSIGDKDAAP
jgi:Emfourin